MDIIKNGHKILGNAVQVSIMCVACRQNAPLRQRIRLAFIAVYFFKEYRMDITLLGEAASRPTALFNLV